MRVSQSWPLASPNLLFASPRPQSRFCNIAPRASAVSLPPRLLFGCLSLTNILPHAIFRLAVGGRWIPRASVEFASQLASTESRAER